MRVIHLRGTQCSGKTYAVGPFLDRPDIGYWDILEFYKENDCIVNDKMDWNIWEKIKPQIPKVLEAFIENCEKKGLTAIIESGTNSTINQVLLKYPNVTTLELKTPDDNTLITRAKARKTSPKRVLEFKQVYTRRHACRQQFALTVKEAQASIKAKLDGINIGIIGTAGRKEDADKMSKQLYTKMYIHAYNYLEKLQLDYTYHANSSWMTKTKVLTLVETEEHQMLLISITRSSLSRWEETP
jgi:hypothetical protein